MAGSTVGLIFSLRADSSNAQAELKKVQSIFAASGRYFDEATLRWRDASGRFVKSLDSDLKTAGGYVNKFGSQMASIGEQISGLGRTLTAAVSAPLAALGALGVRSALDIDQIRTKIIALVGDSTQAGKKIEELRALANNSVGVTQRAALESYAQLKGIGGISDETINKVIQSLGKLNAAFKIEDLAGFNQNLNQIFTQGFERADIKEAIGRVPFFEQLLEQAFGTKDPEKLKALKEAGALTLDSFLGGIAGAIDSDPRVANIQENLTTKLAKGFERLNVALAPIGDVILRAVVPVFETLAPYIESFSNWFSSLSPLIQTFIVAVGGIAAALGPVLIAVGAIIGALAPLVSGIGSLLVSIAAAGSFSTFLAGILATIGSVLTVVIIPALKILIPVAIAVGAALLAVGAAAVALYAAWKTNFGGIRDFAIAAWTKIVEVTRAAYQAVAAIVSEVGGAVLSWWRENYPLIEDTVASVSERIKSTINAFLGAVQSFWQTHGERIKNYAATYWNAVKETVSGVLTQIGNFIRLGLQVINGDWQGVWNTLLKIAQTGAQTLARVWRGINETIASLLAALLPVIVEYGVRFIAKMREWSTAAVVAVVTVLQTLPYKIIAMIPEIITAFTDIGSAMWEGLRKGWFKAARETPIKVQTPQTPPPTTDIQNGSTTTPKDIEGGSSVISAEEMEKRRREREKAFEDELKARQQQNQILLRTAREEFSRVQEEWEKAFADGEKTKEEFRRASLNNIALYEAKVRDLLAKNLTLEQKGKKGTELENVNLEYRSAVLALEREIAQERADVEKTVTEAQKKEGEERIKNAQDQIKRDIALREAASRTVLARYEKDFAEGALTEEQFIKARQNLQLELLNFKKEKLAEELAAVKDNADEETRIRHEQKLLEEEIAQQKNQNAKEAAEFVKKQTREEADAARELLKIKQDVMAAERQLQDFRAEQERKRLENAVEFSRGRERIAALEALRDFEIKEAERQKRQREEDLAAEKAAALERIKDKANEEEQKYQIEQLYKERYLLSEEEFQQRLKEIRDGFNKQTEEEGLSPLERMFRAIREFLDSGAAPTLGEVFANLGSMVGSVFRDMAQAIGQVIQNWVLYGETGPAVMRKILAAALATLAAEAAVKAIFQLAEGFAALFFNPAKAAAHFKAAALYGAVTVAAGVAGRAVAGNAFRQANNQSINNQAQIQRGGAASGASRGAESARVVEQSRNAPSGGAASSAPVRHELTLKLNSEGVLQVVKDSIRRNGEMRGLILQVVEES